MRIVLDTDVIQRDPELRSSHFVVLRDYVRRTASKIVIPQIVYEELRANRGRLIKENLDRVRAAAKKLRKVLPDAAVAVPEIDIDAEVDAYTVRVLRGLRVHKKNIVPYEGDYLPSIVERALSRTKPCSPDGEQFRDAILWATVKDLARKYEAVPVVFISCNTRDFAGPDKELHPDLAAEVDAEGLQIKYFCSLEDFNRQHAVKIAFITEDWLSERLNLETVADSASEQIAFQLLESLNRSPELPTRSTATSAEITDPHLDVLTHYVYELEDGTYRVDVTVEGDVDFEFSFLRPRSLQAQGTLPGITEEHPEMELFSLLHPQQCTGRGTVTVTLEVGVEVEDQEIVDWDVESCSVSNRASVSWRDA